MLLLFILTTEIEFLEKAASELSIPFAELCVDKQDLEFYGYGKFRLKLFDYLIDRPEKIAPFVKIVSHGMAKYSDSLWALSYFPWAQIDEGVMRKGLIQQSEKSLIDSISSINNVKIGLENMLLNDFDAHGVALEHLSDSLVTGLVLIMHQIKKSSASINAAIQSITEKDIDNMIKELVGEQEGVVSNPEIEKLVESVDFKLLAAGAMDFGYMLQIAAEIMRNSYIENNHEISTKFGKIVIGGAVNDVYDDPPYLLIIDFAGEDKYTSCGVSSKKHPISVVIDYQGNDMYEGDIGPGTGICGYGFVVDFAGDDIYHSQKLGLAAGIFGQGMILDKKGNDTYLTDIYGEGAGLFGTGVLSDLEGDDVYKCYRCSQGFGFVKGSGVLIDRQGNDTYIARDDTIKYPAAQSKKHNSSMSQGVGYGVRADYTDGHSLAGGVGMLIDVSGDDIYSCGIFGQGSAYWFGVGFLIDFEGIDEYSGVWYVQGAGAHFGISVLIDSSGNDTYKATMNMAQGAGHDFTLGYLIDYEGNDYHEAPNLSLGGGNANGMGLFVDFSGDDEYVSHGGITLGRASIASRGRLRDHMKCIGVFIDGGGFDKYTEPFAKNGKIWKQIPPLDPPLSTEKCIGIDY